VANTSEKPQLLSIILNGLKKNEVFTSGKCITLKADKDAENTLENPNKIEPEEHTINIENNKLTADIAASSFVIYILAKQ